MRCHECKCLKCKLCFLDARIDSLSSQISSLTSSVESYESRISVLESGVTSSSSSLLSLSMVSSSNQGVEIGVVPFDTTRFNDTDGIISYDASTGYFTISETGNYLVVFDVVYDAGTLTDSDIIFGLFAGGSPVAFASDYVTTVTVNRLTLGEIVQISTSPTEVWFQCITVPNITLANTIVQSNVVFVKIS